MQKDIYRLKEQYKSEKHIYQFLKSKYFDKCFDFYYVVHEILFIEYQSDDDEKSLSDGETSLVSCSYQESALDDMEY